MSDTPSQILLSPPHLGPEERVMVAEAFDTNWIAPVGPHIDAFEAELAAQCGAAGAVAVSSGTAALHLALRLIGVEHGDVVICSSLTFIASVNPALYEGATPVFVDSEPTSWNMCPDALERALAHMQQLGQRVAAIIVVHIYGQSADMDAIMAVAGRFGVPVIEDAAESQGASYRGRQSGTIAPFGIFSFNGNKIITTSGGGALVSDDLEALQHAKKLATQGRDPAEYYQHSEMAYNYRLSNILAGVGRAQLAKLDDRVAARRRIFHRYREQLGGVDGVSWMPEPNWSQGNRWLSVCTFDPARTDVCPAEAILAFRAANIEVRHVWKPMHRQPLFADAPYFAYAEDRSVSDELFAKGLCLPSGSALTEAEQDRVINVLKQLLQG